MTLESIAPMSDNTTVELPDMAAYRPCPPDTAMAARLLHHGSGHDLRFPGPMVGTIGVWVVACIRVHMRTPWLLHRVVSI